MVSEERIQQRNLPLKQLSLFLLRCKLNIKASFRSVQNHPSFQFVLRKKEHDKQQKKSVHNSIPLRTL